MKRPDIAAWITPQAPKMKIAGRKVEKLGIHKPVEKVRAKQTSEHAEQSAVIQWWALAHKGYGLPEFALYAVPNGANKSISQAMKFKREGLRKGTLDLNLDAAAGGFHGLRCELKIKPNRVSQEQQEVLNYLGGSGYLAVVCWSADETISVIKKYLAGEKV